MGSRFYKVREPNGHSRNFKTINFPRQTSWSADGTLPAHSDKQIRCGRISARINFI
jgi:hypothetical protein